MPGSIPKSSSSSSGFVSKPISIDSVDDDQFLMETNVLVTENLDQTIQDEVEVDTEFILREHSYHTLIFQKNSDVPIVIKTVNTFSFLSDKKLRILGKPAISKENLLRGGSKMYFHVYVD